MGYQMNSNQSTSQGVNTYSDQKRIKYMIVSVVVETEDFFSFDAYLDKSKHQENVMKIELKRKEIQDSANRKKMLNQQPHNYKTMAQSQHGYPQQPQTSQFSNKFGASKQKIWLFRILVSKSRFTVYSL
jgi:hypothetical protein